MDIVYESEEHEEVIMNNRKLGNAAVAPLGLGCMRVSSGGSFHRDDAEIDFAPTDDEQSVRPSD